MVEIHNWLVHRCPTARAALASPQMQPMQSKKIPVLGEHNMLLEGIAEDLTQPLEVRRTPDAVRQLLLPRLGNGRADTEMEERARAIVEPLDDRLWQECYDRGQQGL